MQQLPKGRQGRGVHGRWQPGQPLQLAGRVWCIRSECQFEQFRQTNVRHLCEIGSAPRLLAQSFQPRRRRISVWIERRKTHTIFYWILTWYWHPLPCQWSGARNAHTDYKPNGLWLRSPLIFFAPLIYHQKIRYNRPELFRVDRPELAKRNQVLAQHK